MTKKITGFILLLFFCLMAANMSFAGEAEKVEDAFKNGKLSGTIGSYFEFTNRDADDSDFGWATGYLTLKYETLSWNDLKMGARFLAHGQMYSDHDNGVTDPFDADIESQFTLPELYFNYSFAGNSSVTAGRWNHQKVTHIDDAQSEGAYLRFQELEDIEVTAGVMRRFAEIDYDDMGYVVPDEAGSAFGGRAASAVHKRNQNHVRGCIQ